jgi:methyl-accepting chemotaxis protein
MLRQMTHLLGDTSVTLKLALGFSLVLALSFVIAVTGWQALSASLYRSQTLSVLAQLAVAGEELRADRIVYRTLDDTSSFNRLSVSTVKIDGLLVELSSRLHI